VRSKILLSAALVAAAFAVFGDDADLDRRMAAWEAAMKAYAPDLSDSSKYLEPPAEGRLAKPIRLVENGKPLAEIVVDLSDAIRIDNFFTDKAKWTLPIKEARGYEPVVARMAAKELQKWIKEITGATLPVVQKATDEKNVKVFLGASFAKGLFDDDLKALVSARTTDGFAVRAKDGNLYVFGARPAGTLYGALALVENNTDLIWAYPGPGGTVYTKTPTLDVVWGDARDISVFFARGWQTNEDPDWKMHNRSNFDSWDPERASLHLAGGHYFCPQYYDHSAGMQKFNSADKKGNRKIPWMEYYSKLCLSNPDLLRHQLESVPHLQTLRYGAPYLEVFGMDDNANVCQCPECCKPIQALDGRMLTPEKDGQTFWSAQFYQYLNKIDDAIQAKYPGYMTSTFAYFYASIYPPVKVNKTIVPFFCTYWRGNYHLPVFSPKVREWARRYEAWVAHSPETMLYDYYGLAINGQPYAEVYQHELKYQRDIGFLATSTEGFMTGDELGTVDDRWCMARLAWNPDQDLEQLHRRFNRRAYREAAPHMDKIRGLVRQAYYAAHTDDLRKAVGTNETLKAMVAAETEAAEAAVKHPLARLLVNRSVKAWRDFYGIQAKVAATDGKKSGKKEGIGQTFWACSKDNKRMLSRTETGATIMIVPFGGSVDLSKNEGNAILRFTLKADEGVFETRGYPLVQVKDRGSNRFEDCETYMRPGKNGAYLLDVRPPEGSNLAAIRFTKPEQRRGAWQPPEGNLTIVRLETEFDDGTPLMADQLPKPFSAERLRQMKLAYEKEHRSTADIIRERGAEAFVDDRWQPQEERLKVLGDILRKRINTEEGFNADAALAYLRAHVDDTVGRAQGISTLFQGWNAGVGLVGGVIRAFAAKGMKDDAIKVGLAWVKWDGEATPLDFQIDRMNTLRGIVGMDPPGWKDLIVRGTTEGGTSRVRGNCTLTLLNLDKKNLSSSENQKKIVGLLMDEFMANDVRRTAAKLLLEAFRKDGVTDAAAVSNHLFAAYATGDWSNLARACYSHGFGDDYMLDSLVACCERLEKEDQTDAAKQIFNDGVKALRYDWPVNKTVSAELPYYYGNPKPPGYEKEVAAAVKGRYGQVEKLRAKLYPASLEMEEEGDSISLDE